ncbi:DUF2270 domain-containing protein [Herpetosiphon giganteus]|uniref:DUF2270 domain-containing protein n=1 Tax=Herpetosiphon giganteus TaxID=2029754 RepID=UPI001959009A|nr:DUF2270 domain-containing protein [Herpetosiphon giganteus]MBM7843285.1 putative membrane protein [Herpetosiphon giganteus]
MQRPTFIPPSPTEPPSMRGPRVTTAAPMPRAPLPITRPLTPNEFNTALVHLYRGELSRANTWRVRLDGTTNWAVLTTGATLSFAFSSASNTPVMILLNSLLIMFFLFIEARRYRFYDLWRTRVRVMETEFFADMLAPEPDSDSGGPHWRELLAQDLMEPHFNISVIEAMSRRLRRNYVWIFALLALSWVTKVGIHPTIARSFAEVYDRAAVGPLPSWFMLLFGLAFNGGLVWLGWLGEKSQESSGEILSRNEARDKMGSGTPNE